MNLRRLCDNRTPMVTRCVPMADRHGNDVLVVVAKMTYCVGADGAVLVPSLSSPIRMADVGTSDAPGASIRYPSDLVDEKLGTDVLLVGTAYPPADRPVTEMSVSVRVETGRATIQSTVKVVGTRVYYRSVLGVAPGPPAVLGPTPLVYELAFGGREDDAPSGPLVDRRNPVGVGVASDPLKLVGLRAPALEDPRAPLSSRAPAPAGFGPIAAWWSPRAERFGTHDAAWQRERAPLRPTDYNPRASSCAPADLWSEAPLAGDEQVEVLGATPEGVWRFQLPRYAPRFRSYVRGVERQHETHLDTYLIDADARRVELTWRAAIPIPRTLELIDAVVVQGDRPFPESMVEQIRSSERAGGGGGAAGGRGST